MNMKYKHLMVFLAITTFLQASQRSENNSYKNNPIPRPLSKTDDKISPSSDNATTHNDLGTKSPSDTVVAHFPKNDREITLTEQEIAENSYFNNQKLETVVAPNVKIIRPSAFASSSIKEFYGPQLSIITHDAFSECSLLKVFNAPNVTITRENSFQNCESLKRFDFQKIDKILSFAFSGCTDLETFLGSPTRIEHGAFNNCRMLNYIDLSKTNFIGRGAFSNCTALKKINVSKTEIDARAFAGCSGLEEVTLNDSSIDHNTFADCSNLRKVTLSNNTSLKFGAFRNCPIEELHLIGKWDGEIINDLGELKTASITIYYSREKNSGPKIQPIAALLKEKGIKVELIEVSK